MCESLTCDAELDTPVSNNYHTTIKQLLINYQATIKQWGNTSIPAISLQHVFCLNEVKDTYAIYETSEQ